MLNFKYNNAACLFIILLLALSVRLPGIFWGTANTPQSSFVYYHPDEKHLATISTEFLDDTTAKTFRYIKGFSAQIASIFSLGRNNFQYTLPELILTGRFLSLFYGVMTILLIYALAMELFASSSIALLAAMLLTLSGLHVTNSHYATADAGNTFWIYATIFFSMRFIRQDNNIYLMGTLLSCAFALAFKLSFISIIPIAYILIVKKKILNILLVFLYFIIFNDEYYFRRAFYDYPSEPNLE